MAPRRCPRAIPRNQRSIQRLRQRQIRRVVCARVMPQLPDSRQLPGVRIPRQRQFNEVGQRLFRSVILDVARTCPAPQHLCDFQVDQIRGVEAFVCAKDSLADSLSR